MNTTTYTQIYDAPGYHTIYVEFFASTTQFGLQLQWTTPTDISFVSIPASNFFHVPETQFSYTTQIAHYYKNIPIQTNSPVFFGTSYAGTYSITPDLPSGLVFNPSNGQITGTPAEEVDKRDFYVSTASAPLMTSKIIIQVSCIVCAFFSISRHCSSYQSHLDFWRSARHFSHSQHYRVYQLHHQLCQSCYFSHNHPLSSCWFDLQFQKKNNFWYSYSCLSRHFV